jgi:GH24 family phage-related lysozyme (muramidase)
MELESTPPVQPAQKQVSRTILFDPDRFGSLHLPDLREYPGGTMPTDNKTISSDQSHPTDPSDSPFSLQSPASSLRSFLTRHEGLVLRAYKDSRGFWTWGVGCRITDSLICEALDASERGDPAACGVEFELTPIQAESLLSMALMRATRDAVAIFPMLHTYNPPRQTAIISLSYQLGKEGLAGFRYMCRAILLVNWVRAADELRYKNGLTKMEPSDYMRQCPARCEETALMLETGEFQTPEKPEEKPAVWEGPGFRIVDSSY